MYFQENPEAGVRSIQKRFDSCFVPHPDYSPRQGRGVCQIFAKNQSGSCMTLGVAASHLPHARPLGVNCDVRQHSCTSACAVANARDSLRASWMNPFGQTDAWILPLFSMGTTLTEGSPETRSTKHSETNEVSISLRAISVRMRSNKCSLEAAIEIRLATCQFVFAFDQVELLFRYADYLLRRQFSADSGTLSPGCKEAAGQFWTLVQFFSL